MAEFKREKKFRRDGPPLRGVKASRPDGRPGSGDDERRDLPFRRDVGPVSGDDERRGGRSRREGVDGMGEGRLRGALRALIELDRDLMKLLARRAVLVSRIRGGRDNAVSAGAVQAEKAARMAWENNSLAFSKDPRFSRQLFTLLQDLKVLTKEQAQRAGAFNLSPPIKELSGELSGPADIRTAQMYVALAACRGVPLSFDAILFSEPLMDTVKACSLAGAVVLRHGQRNSLGAVSVERGDPVSFNGRMIYLGEDIFTLWLMTFLAIGRPGSCRLVGGARLKEADLSILRQTLPQFGARLAHVVPRSQGLPAMLESSGAIPPLVVIPAALPLEAVCALLLAPLAWDVPVIYNLAALPASVATDALAHAGPLHLACGADVENRGSHLIFTPGPLHVPAQPELPLDPVLSAYLLSMPAFVGGVLTVKGLWAEQMPESRKAAQLLTWAGLSLRVLDRTVAVEADRPPFALPWQCDDLSPELGLLFLALAAKRHHLIGSTPFLRQLAPFPSEQVESDLAQEFFERLGISYADDCLTHAGGRNCGPDRAAAGAPDYPAWTCPNAYWGMAFALASLVRPGLRLANPGAVTEVMPTFWGIYNTLPTLADPVRVPKETPPAPEIRPEGAQVGKPVRRRIIAD